MPNKQQHFIVARPKGGKRIYRVNRNEALALADQIAADYEAKSKAAFCDRLTSEANKLIEQGKTEQTFFLYLPFYDVLTPVTAKALTIPYLAYSQTAGRLGIESKPPLPVS